MDCSDVDYARLDVQHGEAVAENPRPVKAWKWWVNLIASVVTLGVLIVIAVKWIGPFFFAKVVVPVYEWELRTFSPSGLAIITFASLALFPVFFLPSTPSMWLAGMVFGYRLGFLLVMSGVSVAVTITFCVRSLLRNKLSGWLKKHPKQADIIRLAGEGDWFYQFRAIALIRISPMPYMVFNYAVAATDVSYVPYLLGSLVGMAPEVFVALYSGILIRSFADAAHNKESLSTQQIIFNVVGFCLALASTITIGFYTKKRLDQQNADSLI